MVVVAECFAWSHADLDRVPGSDSRLTWRAADHAANTRNQPGSDSNHVVGHTGGH